MRRDVLAAEAEDRPHRFVTLVVEHSMPEYGAAVRGMASVSEPSRVPAGAAPRAVIGLGVLRRDTTTLGEAVDVAIESGTTPAHVAPLPIYDTEKCRPRSY